MTNSFCLFILVISFFAHRAEGATSYKRLVKETNQLLKEYGGLHPHQDTVYDITQFSLSDSIIEQHMAFAIQAGDSCVSCTEPWTLIYDFHDEILDRVGQLLKHKKADPMQLKADLYTDGDFSMVISPDGQLVNYRLFEKSGGTYRSYRSAMFFVEDQVIQATDYGPDYTGYDWEPDGYVYIDTIQHVDTVLYLLQGYVRGCGMCFGSSLDVIKRSGQGFEPVFEFSVMSRSYEGGVEWIDSTRQIVVEYELDDLTSYCFCEAYDVSDDWEAGQPCRCVFEFRNGEFVEIAP